MGIEIPDHESAVRRMVSEAHNISYVPIKDFEEAKKYDNSYMMMEGDWGGQIYLSIPVKQVKCDYETLKKLLMELDKIAWDCNEGEGCDIYFERKESDEGIVGGMGGGMATDCLWVHEEFNKIKEKIQNVLDGKRTSIENGN